MVNWGLQFEGSWLSSLHPTQQTSLTLLIKPLKIQYLTICCADFLRELQESPVHLRLYKNSILRKKDISEQKKGIEVIHLFFGMLVWVLELAYY